MMLSGSGGSMCAGHGRYYFPVGGSVGNIGAIATSLKPSVCQWVACRFNILCSALMTCSSGHTQKATCLIHQLCKVHSHVCRGSAQRAQMGFGNCMS